MEKTLLYVLSGCVYFKFIFYQVSRLAGTLSELGVSRGSRVVIYMPLVPEAVIAMLATNRIGAIHSVVFGGRYNVKIFLHGKPSLQTTRSIFFSPRVCCQRAKN